MTIFQKITNLAISDRLILAVINDSGAETLHIYSPTTLILACKISAKTDSVPENYEPLEFAIFACLLYTSPSPRDRQKSRMPSSA